MRKRTLIAIVAVAIGLMMSGAVFAWWDGGYGMGYGTAVNVDTVKKFQKETLSVRDELMTKQLELQTEYNKPNPDTNRIAALEKEIIDLRAKIQTTATKYGLTAGGYGRGMMMGGGGMMGSGMMMGLGSGGGYCPMGW